MSPSIKPVKMMTREVPDSATATSGAVHVSTFESSYDPSSTLYTNLLSRFKLDPQGTGKLFGSRKLDPLTGEAGPYEWITLNEFMAEVAACSAGMKRELGLQRNAIVGVFSKNRYEWSLVEHSTSRMTYTLVPLYDTLGPTAVPFIMNHTEMSVVFCAKAQFKTLMGCIHDCPSVKTVVQFESKIDGEEISLAREHNVSLMTLEQLMEIGRASPVEPDPPLPSDLCTICYTSGTTGNPKGAMLTHANVMSARGSTKEYLLVRSTDVHLSYLPLAHIFERNVHNVLIGKGSAIGFYQGDIMKLMDDMVALKPTLFPSVPRLLNRIHDKIRQGVAAAGGAKKLLFDQAYAAKKANLKDGYLKHAFWDRLVFNKLQQVLGGRVRLMMSGSAPLAPDVKEFLAIVFSCSMLEGYGLTETASLISCTNEQMLPGKHVGIPVAGAEVRLEDVPDMNYTSKDKPYPRGEVLTRSGHVFAGYYKQPELTKEVIEKDGWFHTGDIGQWNPDGTLSIIDRKKNLFKLSQGEYVSPDTIESVYAQSHFVAQNFVHGDSLKNYLVGIVVPDPEFVAAWALEQGLTGRDAELETLCARGNETLKRAIQEDLKQLAVKAKLLPFERIHKLHLHAEPFTPENGLATPTFKPKRHELVKHFHNVIDELYAMQSKL